MTSGASGEKEKKEMKILHGNRLVDDGGGGRVGHELFVAPALDFTLTHASKDNRKDERAHQPSATGHAQVKISEKLVANAAVDARGAARDTRGIGGAHVGGGKKHGKGDDKRDEDPRAQNHDDTQEKRSDTAQRNAVAILLRLEKVNDREHDRDDRHGPEKRKVAANGAVLVRVR